MVGGIKVPRSNWEAVQVSETGKLLIDNSVSYEAFFMMSIMRLDSVYDDDQAREGSVADSCYQSSEAPMGTRETKSREGELEGAREEHLVPVNPYDILKL